MSSYSYLIDLAILFIIGASVFIGVIRGATREVLGIASWVGAFATLFYGFHFFRPLGRQYIHNTMLADLVVGGVLLILSLAVLILISRFISSSVKGSILGGLDRSLGLVFGLVRGVLLVCLAYLTLSFFYPPNAIPESIKQARLMPWVAQGALELKRLIPKNYLPQNLSQSKNINPLDAQDLIENSLPTLEETVKNLSTLKPATPKPQYKDQEKQDLDKLIEKNE